MSLLAGVKQRWAELGQFATVERKLVASEPGQRLECDLTILDTVGCGFTRFALQADCLQTATMSELKRVSEALAARLTYLLEPIKPIEQDDDQCVIQMRSVPPQREADVTSYYEVLVRRGGELSLCRWAKAAGEVRQPMPAHVTREVFLRLVADFSAAAQ